VGDVRWSLRSASTPGFRRAISATHAYAIQPAFQWTVVVSSRIGLTPETELKHQPATMLSPKGP